MILLKHNGLALVFSTTKMLVRHKIPEVLKYRNKQKLIFTPGYCYSLADNSHRDMMCMHGRQNYWVFELYMCQMKKKGLHPYTF